MDVLMDEDHGKRGAGERSGCLALGSFGNMLDQLTNAAYLDTLIGAAALYPVFIILFVGVAEVGAWFGRRSRRGRNRADDMETLTVSSLGLLALLLAFTLSHALSRYDDRRGLVLEEANAIDSTAKLAEMLPEQARGPIVTMLRDYAAVRTGLYRPYDPAKLERDVARSRELLTGLWQQAVAVSAPESLTVDRFVRSLDEMTKLQETRLMALRYHIPNAALLVLIGITMVALGFTGYQCGLTEGSLRAPNMMMAAMVAVVIVLVIDLDQPARGFITVPTDPLDDVAKEIQP
jgi:hypothetical protein